MSSRTIALAVGSIRKDSINRMLARVVIKLAPKDLACDIVRIDDLPVYNQDLLQNFMDRYAAFVARHT